MSGAVVVFGGSGFIGSHLLKNLADTHRGPIYSIDLQNPKSKLPNVTYLRGDVRDLSTLSIADKVTQIFNLAAVHTTPGHENHEYYETNVLGALEIVKFAKRQGTEHIIFTSSISVYGPSEDTKTESSIPAPESAYGWSKLIAEKIFLGWAEEDIQRKLVIARPAVVFGHGEGGNFTRLARLIKRGVFVYPGRTTTIKSCVYVEDLIYYINFAAEQSDRYVLFNACYVDRYTISDIVDCFRINHFSNLKTFVLPHSLIMMAAYLLRPFSFSGLGIHPERILKLVRSTDIAPQWLSTKGLAEPGRLIPALERWKADSDGRFD